jgi:PiT family inorganic phosphate transporter
VGAIDIADSTAVIYYAFGSGFSMDIKIIGAIGMVLGILLAGGRITGTIGRRIIEVVQVEVFQLKYLWRLLFTFSRF